MISEFDEQSNFFVLKETLKDLREHPEKIEEILDRTEKFILSKKKLVTEIDELRIKAVGGCDESARELMSKLAEMNDGP